MPLADYAEVAERVQRALAMHQELLNTPGGIAHKLDPEVYLVLWPQFVRKLAATTGLQPEDIAQSLARSGYLVSFAPPAGTKAADAANHPSNLLPGRLPALKLNVMTHSGGASRGVLAGFVDASFVERGLALFDPDEYEGPLPLAGLRLAASERKKVEAFFGTRVPPSSLAYASQAV